MRFVLEDSRTKSALRSWANSEVFILSFFIWKQAVQTLQKNIVGVERALLYQILKTHPGLSSFVISEADVRKLEHSLTWTHQRATPILLTVFKELTKTTRCCIFVDGLDELDDDFETMIHLLHGLAKIEHVKICASSRAEAEFDNAFATCPKLRLHELTRKDIENMIVDTLGDMNNSRGHEALSVSELDLLKEAFLEKANEVFLWVKLALASIRQGILYHQPFEQLMIRLEELPKQLENLFAHIVSRIPDEHLIEVSRYMKIIYANREVELGAKSIALTTLSIALTNVEFVSGFRAGDLTISEVVRRCCDAEKRVLLRTAGLLELGSPNPSQSGSVVNSQIMSFDRNGTSLRFIHRTAEEYLLQTPTKLSPYIEAIDAWNAPREIAKSQAIRWRHAERLKCSRGYQGFSRKMGAVNIHKSAHGFENSFKTIFVYLRLAERQTSTAQTSVVNAVIDASIKSAISTFDPSMAAGDCPWFLCFGSVTSVVGGTNWRTFLSNCMDEQCSRAVTKLQGICFHFSVHLHLKPY